MGENAQPIILPINYSPICESFQLYILVGVAQYVMLACTHTRTHTHMSELKVPDDSFTMGLRVSQHINVAMCWAVSSQQRPAQHGGLCHSPGRDPAGVCCD